MGGRQVSESGIAVSCLVFEEESSYRVWDCPRCRESVILNERAMGIRLEMEKAKRRKEGSALMMVVFVIALLSTIVMAILEMNTEEIQLMQNHVYAAEALAQAEAGLNDALFEMRNDSSWTTGFTAKSFNGGTYTVTVSSGTIESTGTTGQSYVAKVSADVTIAAAGPPHVVRIDELRINE